MLKCKDIVMVIMWEGDKLEVIFFGVGNEVGCLCVYMIYKGKIVMVCIKIYGFFFIGLV